MKALKTGLRNLTLLAALGVAMPALLPQPVAARPATCYSFTVPGVPYVCAVCHRRYQGRDCYALTCGDDDTSWGSAGCD